MAELWEVAAFYCSFDPVREGEPPPPALTVRVRDSLSCELAGADALAEALRAGSEPGEIRVLRAPCMGRCQDALTCEVGHAHVDRATPKAALGAVRDGHTHAVVPD